jgi:hypothetical protein
MVAEEAMLVERVTVSEHLMAAEYVSERRAQPRERTPEFTA